VAAVGFVGTEEIAGQRTLDWLRAFFAENPELGLTTFCDQIAEALSAEWARSEYETVLWLFICGATAEGQPIFRAIRNCGPDMDDNLLYTKVGRSFVWHDDLANHLSTYGQPGETNLETLTRALALYRNGVLLPAVAVLDGFPEILGRLFAGGFPGFAPVTTLADYAAVVKMRAEFVKRLFDKTKGVYRGGVPPVAGTVYVWRIELNGKIYDHTAKSVSQITPMQDS
jgi:hypothetical protein